MGRGPAGATSQEVEHCVDVAGLDGLLGPLVELATPFRGGAGWRRQNASRRLWVVKPEPMISTPSSRSGASVRPSSNSSLGSSVGIDTWSTGTSASGNISTSGT